MICSFYFKIFYQLVKGQPSWTNCALRRPAPLNTASSTKAFKMRKALSGTTQEEMCMIREHKFMLILTWAFFPICSSPHNMGVCLPWILLSSGPSFCLFLPTAFSWPGVLLCSDSGPSFSVFFSWPGVLLCSDSGPSFSVFFSWPGVLLCSDSEPSFSVFFSWPGCLLPSDSVSSRPTFFLLFFSLSLSLWLLFLWTGCLFPIDWISSGPSFYVCNYRLLFHELGGCFPSTEFPQDLVFMSLIPDCFFMNWVVASLQFTFLAFYVFSSWLLFDDLGVLLHYSHPCVSFPHAASFPLFLLSPQVAMFPRVLGQHTHHCTAVTTAPLTTSLLLILINRIKFLSQVQPSTQCRQNA